MRALEDAQDELIRCEDFARQIEDIRDEALKRKSDALLFLAVAYDRARQDIELAADLLKLRKNEYESTAVRLGVQDVYGDREEQLEEIL